MCVCVCVCVYSCESLTDTLVTQLASGFLAYKLPLVTQFKYSCVHVHKNLSHTV